MDTNTTPKDTTAQATAKMAALEAWLAPIFAKAPHLPQGARNTIAALAPWLALIFGILGVAGVFSALGLMSAFSPMMYMNDMGMGGLYPMMLVGLVLGGFSSVLELLAFSPLKAMKKKGWNLLFYATTISVISTIVNIVFGYYGLSGIIGAIIGYWLLFEVRAMYK